MSKNSLEINQNKAENNNNINNNNENNIENKMNSIENTDQLEENMNNSIDKRSSQNSIKSNISEDRNTVKDKSNKHLNNKSNSNSNNNSNNSSQLKDNYCWDCHKDMIEFSCMACPRSYHERCPSLKKKSKLHSTNGNTNQLLCPECIDIMTAEDGINPSGCMSLLNGSVDRLAKLLKYTILTVKTGDRNKSFVKPVSTKDWPQYLNYIVNPIDLSVIERNVKNKTYASTNSFLADIKWIHHNCVVFNTKSNNDLISESKYIISVAKRECEEIEICPDCYYNYYTLNESDYFAATCRKPHAIVWAKLYGYPYWPAKVVRINKKNEIDVRYFGTHDKSWLKPDNCYYMSKEYPYNKKPSKFNEELFNDAIRDMNAHLDNLEERYPGLFRFYEKNTFFSINNIYLTKSHESPQKAINRYSVNGVELKKLSIEVNASKFDIESISNAMKPFLDDDKQDIREPLHKKMRRSLDSNSSTDSPKPNTYRSYSTSLSVRKALDTSLESNLNHSCAEPSINSDLDMKPNCGQNKDNNDSDDCDNDSIDRNTETSESNASNGHLTTFTVSGKSSKILRINGTDKSSDSNKFTNGNVETTSKQNIPIDSNFKPKSKISNKSIPNHTNEELMRLQNKITILEVKIVQLTEERDEFEAKVNKAEEVKRQLNGRCDAYAKSIEDIKRKQWCTNCLKEGILPCCWNTCYCTRECQLKHWPIHVRTCRRKQMISTHHSLKN